MSIENTIKVATADARNYEQDTVYQAVKNMFSTLGGLEKFVPLNSKVFVKANLVRDMTPEQAGTTHPEVLIAVCRLLVEQCNATVIVGDSSGGAYNHSYMNTVYRKCGLLAVEHSGYATLNQNFNSHDCKIDGKLLKHTDIIDCFTDADVVINVTKLKTHSFAGYTGAVKNLYGLIAGLVKVTVHSMYPDLDDFCQVLMDIERFASKKTVLHIIDAIMAMEGAGPTNGKPRFVGKLIASPDAYCCDYVATSLFSEPLSQPLLRYADKCGELSKHIDAMQFDMESWQQNYIQDFDRVEVASSDNFFNLPKWVSKLMKRHLVPKVKFIKKCRKCGKCKAHCPANAITMGKKRACVDSSVCIRCFCCQELCPFDAVRIKKPLLYKLICKLSASKAGKTKK